MSDAIVIGAGIIGSTIAWRLAQAGLSVTLLDAGRMGGEATWASAGMLAPGGEVEGRSAWAAFSLESLRMYPAFVEQLTGETGLTVDYRKSGAISIAGTEEEWTLLRQRAASQREIGIRSQELDSAELRACAPMLEAPACGALFYPDDAMVEPRDLIRALRAACQNRGVRLHEREAATAVEASGRSVTVTARGTVRTASLAVLAAGAWSQSLTVAVDGKPYSLPECYPVRGHLLGYRMQPGSILPILRHGHSYIVQRSSGWTIGGTSSENAGFDRTLDPGAIRDIRMRVEALAPILSSAGEPEAWLGFRPGASEPHIEPVPGTRLWLAYGHYRNGILHAPAAARRVCGEIMSSAGRA
ncbi:MAG: glycine oxidase ThiO [Acidobacteria bacterium]|nr:glycine oxidase ThiO [Acidobacteriota bacterium]